MPGAVFVRVLQMSLTGCYSIGIVLAVRLLLKRCGRTCTYYLWVLMFAGLCLPVSMPGHYSLIPRQVAEFSLAEVMMKEEPAEDPGGEKDALRYLEEQEDSRQPVMLHRLPPAGISSGQLQDAAGGRTSAEASAVWNASGVQEEYQKETDAFKPRTPAGTGWHIWSLQKRYGYWGFLFFFCISCPPYTACRADAGDMDSRYGQKTDGSWRQKACRRRFCGDFSAR